MLGDYTPCCSLFKVDVDNSVDWEDEGSVEEIREFFKENGLDFDNAPKHDYYIGGYDDFEECQSAKELWEKKELKD